jgi:molybdopterin converting factor subunit 1
MITVLFFGRVREELDCASLEIGLEEGVVSLDSLQRRLCEQGGQKWSAVLGQDNIIRAVNQAVADGNIGLADGDEVAFFPPVTGG